LAQQDEEAYEAGREAFRMGLRSVDCPALFTSEELAAWHDGWLDAQAEEDVNERKSA